MASLSAQVIFTFIYTASILDFRLVQYKNKHIPYILKPTFQNHKGACAFSTSADTACSDQRYRLGESAPTIGEETYHPDIARITSNRIFRNLQKQFTFDRTKWVFAILISLKSVLMFDSAYSNKQHVAFEKVLKSLNDYRDFIENEGIKGNKREKIQYYNKNKSDLNNTGIERRSVTGELAWVCESEVNWKDLGYRHYPRFVKEVQCLGHSCMHGYYSCLPHNYTVRVLSARQNGDDLQMALPLNLREEWKLVDIQISVACMCRI